MSSLNPSARPLGVTSAAPRSPAASNLRFSESPLDKYLREKELGRILRIETYVFSREVSGQKTRLGAPTTEFDANLIGRLSHLGVGSSAIEAMVHAAPANQLVPYKNVNLTCVDRSLGGADRGQDAPPVWVSPGPGGFHQQRAGYGLGDLDCLLAGSG